MTPPQPYRRPTATSARTLRTGRGKRSRARCALGIPMNASGSTSSRQERRARLPIPGSISTGTAPTLKSAKTSAVKSRDGVTISTVRVPRTIPRASRPWA